MALKKIELAYCSLFVSWELTICLVEPKLYDIRDNMEMHSEWLKLFCSDRHLEMNSLTLYPICYI